MPRQTGPVLYARVKPYDPARGHFVQRFFVPWMGRVIEGGDGKYQAIGWVRVTEKQAVLLKQYRQNDRDGDMSPLVFDIVDEDQRRKIDVAEENARRSGAVFQRERRERSIGGRVLDSREDQSLSVVEEELEKLAEEHPELMNEPVVNRDPVLVAGARGFMPGAGGRMAALEGADDAGPALSRAGSRWAAKQAAEFSDGADLNGGDSLIADGTPSTAAPEYVSAKDLSSKEAAAHIEELAAEVAPPKKGGSRKGKRGGSR